MRKCWQPAFSPFHTMFSTPSNRKACFNLYMFFFEKSTIFSVECEELTHSHTKTPFECLEKKPFENIVEKGEIACPSNFSFSHNVFYPIKERNYHFCYI